MLLYYTLVTMGSSFSVELPFGVTLIVYSGVKSDMPLASVQKHEKQAHRT